MSFKTVWFNWKRKNFNLLNGKKAAKETNKIVKFSKIGATSTIHIVYMDRTRFWSAHCISHIGNFVIDNFTAIKYQSTNMERWMEILKLPYFRRQLLHANEICVSKEKFRYNISMPLWVRVRACCCCVRVCVYRLRCTAYDCREENGQHRAPSQDSEQETNTLICL